MSCPVTVALRADGFSMLMKSNKDLVFKILHDSARLHFFFHYYFLNIDPTRIDPPMKQLVEEKYLQLMEAIKDLESRRDQSLSTQKEELSAIPKLENEVAALNDEIVMLKEEISSLKLDKVTLEEKIASDERVCSLEKERDYYRKESIRLNAAIESMKKKSIV